MEFIICFIDDSRFEHDLVRNEIAPYASQFHFIQAYTFDEALNLIGNRIPILFLLDLWGQDEDVANPVIIPKNELIKQVSQFVTLDNVYDGLDTFEGDKNNEFLKRLFTIVKEWRVLFEEACSLIGQNRKYGLSNLRLVRDYYPGVPAVFYTRKSLISDAVAMFKAGTDGLLIKPTGNDNNKTRLATKKFAPELIRDLSRIIDSKIGGLYQNRDHYLTKPEKTEYDPLDLLNSWKKFRDN